MIAQHWILSVYYTQFLAYVEVDMERYRTVKVILNTTDAERRSICLGKLLKNTPCLLKHKSTIALLYNKYIYAFPANLDN